MGSAQVGSPRISCFFDRDFWGTPVNLLLSPKKCQGVPFSPICRNVLFLRRPRWCWPHLSATKDPKTTSSFCCPFIQSPFQHFNVDVHGCNVNLRIFRIYLKVMNSHVETLKIVPLVLTPFVPFWTSSPRILLWLLLVTWVLPLIFDNNIVTITIVIKC